MRYHLKVLNSVIFTKCGTIGNIPPRDVLASGTPEQVYETTKKLKEEASGFNKMLFSCAGGMPPAVSTENINAF